MSSVRFSLHVLCFVALVNLYSLQAEGDGPIIANHDVKYYEEKRIVPEQSGHNETSKTSGNTTISSSTFSTLTPTRPPPGPVTANLSRWNQPHVKVQPEWERLIKEVPDPNNLQTGKLPNEIREGGNVTSSPPVHPSSAYQGRAVTSEATKHYKSDLLSTPVSTRTPPRVQILRSYKKFAAHFENITSRNPSRLTPHPQTTTPADNTSYTMSTATSKPATTPATGKHALEHHRRRHKGVKARLAKVLKKLESFFKRRKEEHIEENWRKRRSASRENDSGPDDDDDDNSDNYDDDRGEGREERDGEEDTQYGVSEERDSHRESKDGDSEEAGVAGGGHSVSREDSNDGEEKPVNDDHDDDHHHRNEDKQAGHGWEEGGVKFWRPSGTEPEDRRRTEFRESGTEEIEVDAQGRTKARMRDSRGEAEVGDDRPTRRHGSEEKEKEEEGRGGRHGGGRGRNESDMERELQALDRKADEEEKERKEEEGGRKDWSSSRRDGERYGHGESYDGKGSSEKHFREEIRPSRIEGHSDARDEGRERRPVNHRQEALHGRRRYPEDETPPVRDAQYEELPKHKASHERQQEREKEEEEKEKEEETGDEVDLDEPSVGSPNGGGGNEPIGPIRSKNKIEKLARRLPADSKDTIPWREPKMLSNCWFHAMTSYEHKFGPSCNPDGSYSPKQCYLQRPGWVE